MADKSFEQLWKHFVPRDGAPRNPAGEVLRAVARIGHEISINEGANWEEDHDVAAALIGTRLAEQPLLDSPTLKALEKDVASIRALGASRSAGSEDAREAMGRVRVAVIDWCNRRLALPSDS